MPRIIQVNKVKYSKDKIFLSWTVVNEETGLIEEQSTKSNQAPEPEFLEALQSIDLHVVDICELGGLKIDSALLERMTVTGVSYSYTDGIMGAVLVAQLALKHNDAPLNLVTPHKFSMPINEAGDPEKCLSAECIEALEALSMRARRFIYGERAQLRLAA